MVRRFPYSNLWHMQRARMSFIDWNKKKLNFERYFQDFLIFPASSRDEYFPARFRYRAIVIEMVCSKMKFFHDWISRSVKQQALVRSNPIDVWHQRRSQLLTVPNIFQINIVKESKIYYDNCPRCCKKAVAVGFIIKRKRKKTGVSSLKAVKARARQRVGRPGPVRKNSKIQELKKVLKI